MEKDDDALPKKRPAGFEEGEDDSAKGWFANQLNDDASASVAIPNGLLNAEREKLASQMSSGGSGMRSTGYPHRYVMYPSPHRRLSKFRSQQRGWRFQTPISFHSTDSFSVPHPSPVRSVKQHHPRPVGARRATNAPTSKLLGDPATSERSIGPPPVSVERSPPKGRNL
jgi:hypothetical protein